MDIKKLVIDVISRNAVAPLPPGDDSTLLNCRYLDEGIIDSLGIINLITDFESLLSISFSAEDMQSYDFQTINGLIGIIDNKLSVR
jgi:acyl carrier protein